MKCADKNNLILVLKFIFKLITEFPIDIVDKYKDTGSPNREKEQ